ncbi:MAG: glycine zipper family protein, partial [Peristeroidobacter soli]
MRRQIQIVIASALAAVLGTSAMSSTPIIYPAKNQTPEQQKKDEGECNAWAKQNTGVDPVVLASTPTTVAPPPAGAPPPPSGPSGARVKGAARGAAAGAVIGEIDDGDASDGAAKGAAVGAVVAGSRQRRQGRAAQEQAAQQKQQVTQQQQAAQQQAEADKKQKMDTYNRAYGACLEGRGYTL